MNNFDQATLILEELIALAKTTPFGIAYRHEDEVLPRARVRLILVGGVPLVQVLGEIPGQPQPKHAEVRNGHTRADAVQAIMTFMVEEQAGAETEEEGGGILAPDPLDRFGSDQGTVSFSCFARAAGAWMESLSCQA